MEHAVKPGRTSGHFHAVRFYENDESLCRIVAEFLGEGIVSGQPALVIATPEHRDDIVQELRARLFRHPRPCRRPATCSCSTPGRH